MNHSRKRAASALAVLATASLLVGCTSANHSDGETHNRPQSDGSNLPFEPVNVGSNPSDDGGARPNGGDAPAPTQNPAPTQDPNGGSAPTGNGDTIVRYGDVDLSNRTYEVTCLDSGILAQDGEQDVEKLTMVDVSLDSSGKVTMVTVFAPSDMDSLYMSDQISGTRADEVQYDGKTIHVTGTGNIGFSSQTADFEIQLTCTTVF